MLKGSPSLFLAVALSFFVPSWAWAQGQLDPYQVMHWLAHDEGSEPQSGLVRGADNRLYGTATNGGSEGVGTIYRITTDGTFEVVHNFLASSPQGGLNPVSLIRGRDKNLYGTTDYGGTLGNGDGNPVGDGVIYRLNWNETLQTYSGVDVLHMFNCATGEGGDPWGALVEGPDGALYGMTIPSDWPDEDCSGASTVFKLNKDGTGFAVLARFDYLVTGSNQFGPLVFGSDGSIWGTLNDSANQDYLLGSIFKIAPNGSVTYPKIFQGADGANPFSGLVRGVDGAFYGTTSGGGDNGVGTIFRIDESGNFTSLYSFDSASIHTPFSPLVAGGDGILYGAAHAGGPDGYGGSYIFDPPAPIGTGGGFTLHATFDNDTTGSSPWGPLGVGPDRHLYGTQIGGGRGNQGTLFGLLDIEVANRPPVPVVIASPSTTVEAVTPEGATISLNALGSWDADFDDLTYSWTVPVGPTIVSGDPSTSPTISATFPEGSWPVTLTVSDGTTSRSLVVSIEAVDGPPMFSPVSPITVSATSASGAVVNYTPPTATDIIDSAAGEPAPLVTCSPDSGAEFSVGTTTVICTATDSKGHESTTSFDVTVTLELVITVPADQTLEATSPSGAPFTYTATVSGSEEGLVPTCSPALTVFPLGTTPVTCSVDDPQFGHASATFNVTVVDTTAPEIVLGSGTEFNAEGPDGALVEYVITAVDLVDEDVTAVCTPPPGMFPLGLTRVTCEAIDDAGNKSVRTIDFAVRDSDYPELTMPGPMFVEAQSAAGATVTYSVTATDATSPDVTVSCTPASNTTFAIGATTVQCTATDDAGHTTTGSFIVTVRDTTPPVVTVPGALTAQATGPSGAVVNYSVSATDLVGVSSLICAPASGSTFPLGVTPVTCTAKDAAGNTGTGSFSVTVEDTTGPAITVPANIVVVTESLDGEVVTYSVSANDLVDGGRPVTCSPLSGSTFPANQTTTVNCVSFDSRGNRGTASFTVTVVTQPPTLVVTLTPGVLWPPNHKMVTINATIVATSVAGPPPVVTLVSITSNEPDNGLGDGDTPNDIQDASYGTDDRVFQLRSERSGTGTDRVYTVTYKATSPLNSSIATTWTGTLIVPHDMRDKN